MKEYNIWDLEGVNIKVKREFIIHLNKKIIEAYKTKRKLYSSLSVKVPYGVFKNMLKVSYYNKWFVPLDFLIDVCSKLGISKEKLQENIISYKSWGSVNYIEKPKFPIVVTPVFHMIYAHNIGDGTVSIAKNRFPYFAYRQFNQLYRESFIKKLEYIFGNINYRKKEVLDITRVRCPSVLSSIFFKHYDLNDRGFLSDTARISNSVFNDSKDAMLAVLIGFIIDEGHVDSTQIAIVLKNKELVEDLNKICSELGYKSTISYKTGEYEKFVGLNILREGMKKLYWVIPVILLFLYLVLAALRQAMLLQKSRFFPSGYRINSIGAFEISITVFFDIENNMDIDIILQKVKLKTIINNIVITTINKENVKVPAHSIATVEALIVFNPAELFYGSLPYLTDIKNLPLGFKGYIDISTNYFYNRIPIEQVTTLKEMLQK